MFQSTHMMISPVIHARNLAVPMKRAKVSAKRPNISGSRSGRRIRVRRSLGTSSRRGLVSRTMLGLPPGVVVTPARGQHVVQDVIDGHDPDEVPELVDHGAGHQV